MSALNIFMSEYRKAVAFYCDYLFSTRIIWGKNSEIFDIKHKQYNCPTMLSTVDIKFESLLSARALKCASTQACGIVKSLVERQKRRIWIRNELRRNGVDNPKLNKKIKKWKLPKLQLRNINAELNSICADFKWCQDGKFTGFLQLKSLGKSFGKIKIPVPYTKPFEKWSDKGEMKHSFLINETQINIRFEIEKPELKTEGTEEGADQGMKTCVTLSDGQVTQKNKDGYDLDIIAKMMARKKRGSKAFQKAAAHRENYINWSINNLNFSKIKKIGFEEIVNIGYRNGRSEYLSHFTNTLIRDKMQSRCEEIGVQFVMQSAAYRSQRCSRCGFVQDKNRRKKLFLCGKCKLVEDADFNASLNHKATIPSIPKSFLYLKLNKEGFYWLETGVFKIDGSEFTVPNRNNEIDL